MSYRASIANNLSLNEVKQKTILFYYPQPSLLSCRSYPYSSVKHKLRTYSNNFLLLLVSVFFYSEKCSIKPKSCADFTQAQGAFSETFLIFK